MDIIGALIILIGLVISTYVSGPREATGGVAIIGVLLIALACLVLSGGKL